MENAVKALEYAFAILIFVIALSASIYLLSEVKTTSDIAFSRIDTKQFYQDATLRDEELTSDGNIKYNGRIVNIETIVPSLYRDYKENYVIEFYKSTDDKPIIRFDLSTETRREEIWTGNPNVDVKKRLDLFLRGSSTGTGEINKQIHDLNTDVAFVKKDPTKPQSPSDYNYNIDRSEKNAIVTKGFYDYCKGKTFTEEYAYVLEPADNKKIEDDITKIVIRYREQG